MILYAGEGAIGLAHWAASWWGIEALTRDGYKEGLSASRAY